MKVQLQANNAKTFTYDEVEVVLCSPECMSIRVGSEKFVWPWHSIFRYTIQYEEDEI